MLQNSLGFRVTLENLEKVSFLRKLRENLKNSEKNFYRLEDSGKTQGIFFRKSYFFYMHKIHLYLKYVLPVIFLRNHTKFSKLNDSVYLIIVQVHMITLELLRKIHLRRFNQLYTYS